MPEVLPRPLPDGSLLARVARSGEYADCWSAAVAGEVTLTRLIDAFFTSPVFRFERLVLRLIGRGGSDSEAAALARGEARGFAAWSLEARLPAEILLRDFAGRTRCWLAVEPNPGGTLLSFGTGIARRQPRRLTARAENAAFSTLVPVHRRYARALLASTARRVDRRSVAERLGKTDAAN